MTIQHLKRTYGFAAFLSLLVPGLGHMFWAEYLFGIFVFLILLIAVALFFFSFLIPLPYGLKMTLFALPIVFYLFTFFDLYRTVAKVRSRVGRSSRTAVIYLVGALVVVLLAPISPVNFLMRNSPGLIWSAGTELAPVIRPGQTCLVDRTAYAADLFFLDDTFLHTSPARLDPVRFRGEDGSEQNGLILGLTHEEIAFQNDTLFVDGAPFDTPARGGLSLGGSLTLTPVASRSILAVTFNDGKIDQVYTVYLRDLVGKLRVIL